ncbi:Sodium/hydrogen exchanger family-domain-containing protein [Phascolomyces articulosus]|uniref:Sodium/hydrogen exchanger family-domain-containing protein n=1 Tax=Phascolomyces articulosus TaxID=60185 RepID=A0AAD5KA41_9FUNG|nr:Sodium/hydrogen exchanger family-domain-containing protein [Phascolomyces articulosus]
MPATPQAGIFAGLNPAEFNSANPIVLFIIQTVIILVFCRVLAIPLGYVRQPRVIAEVIAGIILGPSVMGRIPNFTETIFPMESLPFLNLAATLGLIFFLFQVGLEVDVKVIRRDWRESLSIALAGMALPFGLGIAVSVGLYKLQNDDSVPFSSFMLFLGVALAITAFPVLARILAELNLLRTKVGAITMASGLLNDCTAWVLLALVVALLNATNGLQALYVFLTAVGFGLFLIFLVRPLYIKLCIKTGSMEHGPTPLLMTVTFVIVLASAFMTDIIGVHPIFGGFLAGTIIPHENDLATKIAEKTEDLVNILLLPLYFTLSGLKTQIGLLNSGPVWGYVFLVIFLACFGKITGCTAAAKFCGMSLRESFTVGFLMNCKGLVELIVLNIGHDAGVLNDQVFVIMVVMALITTFMTTPVVIKLYPEWYQKQRAEELREANGGDPDPSIHPSTSVVPTKDPSMLVSGAAGGVDKFSLVTMLNRLETVPSIMALIKHLKQPRTKKEISFSNSSTGTGSDDTRFTTHIMELHALRLLELTERASDVMKIRDQRETQRYDPVLNVIRTFSSILGIDALRTRLEFRSPNEYIKTIADHSEQVDADMILLPWTSNRHNVPSTPAATKDDEDINPFDKQYQQHQYPVPDVEFATSAFAIKHTTVGLFIDRGFGLVQDHALPSHATKIIVPFIGGSDDRSALMFALRLQLYHQARALVLRFVIKDHKKDQEVEEVEGISEKTTEIKNDQQQIKGKRYASVRSVQDMLYGSKSIRADMDDDDTLFTTLFTLTNEEENPNVACITIDDNTKDSQLYDVISTINHHSKKDNLGRHDLIVLGRHNKVDGKPWPHLSSSTPWPVSPSVESPSGQHHQYSKEFKSVLGALSFGLLSSNAQSSLVVVQSATHDKRIMSSPE